MEIFARMSEYGYEQVVFCHDPAANLRAIIAIHDTTLGPALGGCRMWPYSSEDEAINDVLRLARGMTYKNAAAGLNLGGGKSVIIGDPKKDKSEALFRAFGRFVQSLQGRYITAEDVGINVEDMDIVHMETDFVTGISAPGSSGDPSLVTAYGVWQGMKACAMEVWHSDSLRGRRVAIQGAGHVGYHLAEHLREEGAEIFVSDINEDNLNRFVRDIGARAVGPDEIYGLDVDIFAPCALGAILNEKTIPVLKAKVVAGSANNQLATTADGDALEARGILYAPDYVINAGGVINVADELEPGGYNHERAMKKAGRVRQNVERVIAIAKRDHVPTYVAADRMAEERIAIMAKLKTKYVPAGLA